MTPKLRMIQPVLKSLLKPIWGGLLAAAVFVPSASALSCMPPDLAYTMEQAKASDDIYYILVGKIASKPLPKVKESRDPNAPMNGVGSYTGKGMFDGYILSSAPQNDSHVKDMRVDIAVSCGGPWCGNAPQSDREIIAFVKERPGQPLLLEVGPCADKVHYIMEDKNQVETLRSCFSEKCVSDNPFFDRR